MAEMTAHDDLRAALRNAALATWDRKTAEAEDPQEWSELRPEIESGVLVDYVTVASFDSGNDDHSVVMTLRTDGQCASYRTVGLLTQALDSLKD